MKFVSHAYSVGRSNVAVNSAAAPNAPVLTIADTGRSGTGFTITWPAVSGATKYYIDANTASDFSGTAILDNVDAGNVTTYDISGFTLGTTIYTRARAYNSAGTSSNSATVTYARYNLLRHTQEFDDSFWVKTGANSITANSTTAPDGTLTADTLTETAIGATYGAGNNAVDNFVLSIYVKKSAVNFVAIYNPTANAPKAWFNIATGTVGTVVTDYTALIEDVGNGWYRCVLKNSVAQAFNYFQLTLSLTDGGNNAVGDDYIWGAQGEAGTTLSPYQKIV